jgi:hypothetical protein
MRNNIYIRTYFIEVSRKAYLERELRLNMYKIVLKILVFITILIYSPKTFSQERKWILFYENDSNRYFYDSMAIHPHGDIIYVWQMSERINEGWKGYGSEITYNISRVELMCNEKRYRTITSTDFHSDGSTTTDNARSKYYSADLNSESMKLMNIFCKNN